MFKKLEELTASLDTTFGAIKGYTDKLDDIAFFQPSAKFLRLIKDLNEQIVTMFIDVINRDPLEMSQQNNLQINTLSHEVLIINSMQETKQILQEVNTALNEKADTKTIRIMIGLISQQVGAVLLRSVKKAGDQHEDNMYAKPKKSQNNAKNKHNADPSDTVGNDNKPVDAPQDNHHMRKVQEDERALNIQPLPDELLRLQLYINNKSAEYINAIQKYTLDDFAKTKANMIIPQLENDTQSLAKFLNIDTGSIQITKEEIGKANMFLKTAKESVKRIQVKFYAEHSKTLPEEIANSQNMNPFAMIINNDATGIQPPKTQEHLKGNQKKIFDTLTFSLEVLAKHIKKLADLTERQNAQSFAMTIDDVAKLSENVIIFEKLLSEFEDKVAKDKL